jgi:hypothetical protein
MTVTMTAPFSSGTVDPGEERLAEAARLPVAWRGDPVRIQEAEGDPYRRLRADGGLLPSPHATLAGPTFL